MMIRYTLEWQVYEVKKPGKKTQIQVYLTERGKGYEGYPRTQVRLEDNNLQNSLAVIAAIKKYVYILKAGLTTTLHEIQHTF